MIASIVASPLATVHAASNATDPSLPLVKVLVSAPPSGDKGPDDIALLSTPSLNGGNPVVWTAYQNGIQANGTAGSLGGPTQSTIVGYDASTGALVKTIQVTGKSDGLSSDPVTGMLVSTLNEDSHSSLAVVDPSTGQATYYTYNPDPAVSGNGGTDSIAIVNGGIYLAHSNPNDATQPAVYQAALDDSTHTAYLTPVYYDNSAATSINTGGHVTLGLSDPDTNFVMPAGTPSFPGALAQISQADGQIIFSTPSLTATPNLQVLNVTDNKAGNIPPIDGFAVATASQGTLYVVDAKAGTIQAFNTTGWPVGTVFVGEPSDNANPLVGTLNLKTGIITPFSNTFASPKGLLFVPEVAGGADAAVTITATQTTTQTATQTTTTSNSSVDGVLYGAVAVLAVALVAVGYVAMRRRE
jgi:hypothetical protein